MTIQAKRQSFKQTPNAKQESKLTRNSHDKFRIYQKNTLQEIQESKLNQTWLQRPYDATLQPSIPPFKKYIASSDSKYTDVEIRRKA